MGLGDLPPLVYKCKPIGITIPNQGFLLSSCWLTIHMVKTVSWVPEEKTRGLCWAAGRSLGVSDLSWCLSRWHWTQFSGICSYPSMF